MKFSLRGGPCGGVAETKEADDLIHSCYEQAMEINRRSKTLDPCWKSIYVTTLQQELNKAKLNQFKSELKLTDLYLQRRQLNDQIESGEDADKSLPKKLEKLRKKIDATLDQMAFRSQRMKTMQEQMENLY